jgi:cysteine desulfurase family protein (TIGR01976 family)
MSASLDVQYVRAQFPALTLRVAGRPAVFFDGPAGSQVPQCVVDAVSDYLTHSNANHGGTFETGRRSDEILHNAHAALADFLGTPDPGCIAFGANMTTLTFALSRALGRTWKSGDEVIVTDLDHDANVTPWVLAARDAGAIVRRVRVQPEDATLDLDDFRAKLSTRTKLVAVGYASNITGTINPVREMISAAHRTGAQVFIDAVHYAPHGSIDVTELDCDFLACSAYKFFGPHVGILYGKREQLETIVPYKLRPVPDTIPDSWMTGTQCHEGIAGAAAAVEYLAGLGRTLSSPAAPRREALKAAYRAITEYERQLATELIDGLQRIRGIRIWGITDPARHAERAPTVSITHDRKSPAEIAVFLAEQGIFVWSGNHYALPFTEAMHLEPAGTLRVGLLHYNTAEDVDRLLAALGELFG